MQLRFQKCQATDLELLVQVSKSTFSTAFEKANNADDFKTYIDQAFSRKTLSSELNNANTSFYFVFDNTNLVGYFKLNENDAQTDLKTTKSLELERIYILENFQGNGIGKWILEEVKKIAKSKQKKFLWLGVWEENVGAIRFYKKQGFSKFGTHPYYVGSDKQTDWLMRFDLRNFGTD